MPTFKVKNNNGEWENVVSFFGSAGEGGVAVETDPTVPAWAKAANKPTYTANEVGAYSKSEIDNMDFSEQVNEAINSIDNLVYTSEEN